MAAVPSVPSVKSSDVGENRRVREPSDGATDAGEELRGDRRAPPTELDPGLDLGEAGVVIKAFLGLVEIKRLLRRGNNLRRAEGERLISRLTARPPTSRCGGASEEFATNGAEFFPRAPEHSYIPVYGRKVAGSRAPREFIPIRH